MSNLLSSHRRTFTTLSLLAAGAALSANCTLDLEGAGTGGGAGTTTSTSSMGGSMMVVCTANTEVRPCYGGFTETEGKGTCKRGQQTCNADGNGFGECVGEVLPAMADDCAKSLDTTCDGKLSCPCTPKATTPCYDGLPASTADVGICKSGKRTCNDDGKDYGDCIGQIKPAVENCLTDADENCDNLVNGPEGGCVCDPTVMVPVICMTSLPGECVNGTQVCAADGKGYDTCIANPIFQDCFTPTDKDCYGMPPAACVGTSTLAGVAGMSSTDDSVFAVASDSLGNIFLGGVAGSSAGADYGVTSGSAEITKLDKSGAQVWKKSYQSTGGFSVVRGVAVDGAGNIILIGEYQGTVASDGVSLPSTVGGIDVFVVKLDTDGNPKWSKSFSGFGDQYGASVSAAANGDVFILGTMNGVMNFDAQTPLGVDGGPDVFVARLDATTGVTEWSKNFGNVDFQYGWSVAATPDGNVAVTGQFNGDINFGKGNLGNKGKRDIFLAKLDGNNGGEVWAQSFGDGADQVGYGVAADSNGDIVITGVIQGDTSFGGLPLKVGGNQNDLFVARFGSDGVHQWSKRFGDTNAQTSRALALDAAGNVLITGYFKANLQFDTTTLIDSNGNNNAQETDVFVAKLKASDGSTGWARSFGDMSGQVSWAVAADPLGNVILGGTFKGTIGFGSPITTFTNTSNYDSFWAKLAP